MTSEEQKKRIEELEKALENIINQCVPGVAGYHVIRNIAKKVLNNESR